MQIPHKEWGITREHLDMGMVEVFFLQYSVLKNPLDKYYKTVFSCFYLIWYISAKDISCQFWKKGDPECIYYYLVKAKFMGMLDFEEPCLEMLINSLSGKQCKNPRKEFLYLPKSHYSKILIGDKNTGFFILHR